jgi:protease II
MIGLVWTLLYNIELAIWLLCLIFLVLYYFDVDIKKTVEDFLVTDDKVAIPISNNDLQYPSIEGVIETDKSVTVHEKTVNNPMAVLEDLSNPSNANWIQSQLTLTENYTKKHLNEIRKKFANAIRNTNIYESIENPIHFGSTYFFFKKLRPEIPQYSLFSTNNLDIEAKLVFDPNTVRFPSVGSGDDQLSPREWDEDDDDDLIEGMIYIHGTWISLDGYKLAYGYTTELSSRSLHIRVRDLKTGKDLSDTISNCYVDYTSVTWLESRTGFFYTTQVILDDPLVHATHRTSSVDDDMDDNPNPKGKQHHLSDKRISNRVLFHKIGTSETSDFLVFETLTTHDNVIVNTEITSDNHYLLIDIFKKKRDLSCNSFWRSTISEHASASSIGNKIYYFDLTKFDAKNSLTLGYCYKLIDTFAYRFDYISNIEDDFWFRTNFKAPNFRVVRITLPDLSLSSVIGDDQMSNPGSSHDGIITSSHRTYSMDGKTDHDIDEVDIASMNYKFINAWKQCLDWIPQRLDGDYLESATIAAHTVLVLKYLKNSSHEVLLYDLTQNLVQESQIPVADLPHPPHGTINGPNCNFYSQEIFYQYISFNDPSSIYRAVVDRDPFNGSIEISFHQVNSTEIPGLDKYHYETIQEFCETKRNVYVPVLRFGRRSNLEQIEPKPCIVYINGGFGITATPFFSLPFVLFSEHCDGITVLTNVQGSGMLESCLLFFF